MTMIGNRFLPPVAPLLIAALLGACSQPNTGDQPAGSGAPVGIERFLLFPNPIAPSTQNTQDNATYEVTFETDTDAYATAYYHAIDPTNAKATLNNWKTANGFGTGVNEHLAVFRDVKDLGYGRRMTGRMNGDGSVAFYVQNYAVTNVTGSGYGSLNVEAAVAADSQWHVGTNAIEWSAATCNTGEDPVDCNPGVKFAKYYNFAPDGTRQLRVDLDGKGLKAMPGACISCHGGSGEPLTPVEANGKPRFPLIENTLSRKRGDTLGRLQGMNVDSFEYSVQAGFAKSDQQAFLKDFNQWILCTYPAPGGGTVTGTWGSCTRPTAGANEWQGTAAEMIQAWYGGNTMLNATFADTYIPAGWNTGATLPLTTITDKILYQDVVAPFCRTCHSVRGTANQSDIDFITLTKFHDYADRIKAHVFERGNMPLALIVYDDFWNSPAPGTLARYIDSVLGPQSATTASNDALMPGRPIANPGPNRMVRVGANATLSAEDSLFATTYGWSLVSSNPPGQSATITNASSNRATFLTALAGDYTVKLTVGNGSASDSKNVVITADSAFPDPSTFKFAQVRNLLENVLYNGSTKCIDCHTSPTVLPTPPIFYNSFDRNGDLLINATDDAWFDKEVTGRVNLTEMQASPLLRKPSGNHHRGGTLFNLATSAGLNNYSIIYNWILAGMPTGGVAANPVVNGGVDPAVLTFGGTFPGPYSASLSLDGSQSLGPSGATLTYSWSVVSQPMGGNAAIGNTALAVTTLTVQNVGVYVVQLQVMGGGFTDTVQRSFTVSETPIVADFTPGTGSTAVTFSGSPARGNITLTNTSSAGSPNTCRWLVVSGPGVASSGVSGPGGPLLNNSTTLDTGPLACTTTFTIFGFTFTFPATATLNVPFTAVGGTYVVQFTASNIGSNAVTHNITVTNGTPVVANIVVNGGTTPVVRSFTGGTPLSGIPSTASVSLNGNGSSGVLPLTFSWSITAQPDSTNGPASLSSTTAAAPTLTVRATGSYTVRLQVTDSASNTNATTSTFNVNPTNGTTFSTMTGLFVSLGCTGCHTGGGVNPANNSGTPPDWTITIGSDGSTLWQRVFQRVDLGTAANSLLLLNPENITNSFNPNGHGGGCRPGFGCDGTTGSANLTTFTNWILDGGAPGN
jgi:hypothetical protein